MYDCSGKEGVFIVVLECGYLYGNKEEQPHRGNVWVSIITYSLGHLT